MSNNEKKKSTGADRGVQPQKSAGKRTQFADIKFLNVVLSEADKSAASHWIASNPPIWDIMDGLVSEGYKFSFSVDQRSRAVMATITDRREGSQYANHCFTVRGRDFGTAMLRVCWVHAVRYDGDWSEITEPSDVGDVW